MEESTLEFVLPGFRFHPTEEELLDFYLKNMVFRRKLRFDVIGFLNIYRHDPWDLPRLANIGEREWYFFVPRDRKHGSGGRPNRTTARGFWKATGSDRKIFSLSEPRTMIGLKKTLVFYQGRAPRGSKTDWVMNEYRLPDTCPSPKEIVLCKIYRKATSLKVLEQRATMEEEMKRSQVFVPSSPITPPMDNNSFCGQLDDLVTTRTDSRMVLKKEDEGLIVTEEVRTEKTEEIKGRRTTAASTTIQLPTGEEKLEIQVPIFNMDYDQDSSFWTPLCSTWFDNLTPYANLLNY